MANVLDYFWIIWSTGKCLTGVNDSEWRKDTTNESARGGGSEFLLSLDMRFAAIGRPVLSQPEVALGILPAGGGTQRLPRRYGRARAAETIFGCEDFDAELAERYGWWNRALPPGELAPFVDRLAGRMAAFPPEAIALAKQGINAADPPATGRLVGRPVSRWSMITTCPTSSPNAATPPR